MRIGFGYDAHRLVADRKLILGGVEIPFERGLMGHSDADVLCHAIADALLGAAGLGDIGKHFPDTDSLFKGISSIQILEKVGDMLKKHSFVIVNIDSTLVLEKPKISKHIHEMVKNITHALKIEPDQISIKGKTTEGLGFTGMGDGIEAHAVALVIRK
jgi:2-C-methyl-D-erythritol 2,4-cyclodiphosphate synthase